MADYTLQTGLPNLPLKAGMKLKLEAISPTTGLAITGVTVTDWAIYAYDVASGGVGEFGPFMLVSGPAA